MPVEIPTVYDGEPSHFRPVRDTVSVGAGAARACVHGPGAPGPRRRAGAARMGAATRRLDGRGTRDRARAARAAAARQPALPRGQRPRRRTRVALPGLRPAHAQLHRALHRDARGGGRSPEAAALRDRHGGVGPARRLPRRRRARGRQAVRRARAPRGGARGRRAALGGTQLVPPRLVPLGPSDGHGRDGRRGRERRPAAAAPAARVRRRDRRHPRPLRRPLPHRRGRGGGARLRARAVHDEPAGERPPAAPAPDDGELRSSRCPNTRSLPVETRP